MADNDPPCGRSVNAVNRPAALNPAELSANYPKTAVAKPDAKRRLFAAVSQHFFARSGIASHARGRWFETSRAHYKSWKLPPCDVLTRAGWRWRRPCDAGR
jgi:hypothetical protein